MSATRESPLRFLALGDSYTIGEGVAETERWPNQLVARLREHGVDIADPTIVARTGWTTHELAAGIDSARPAGPFDLVTLLIGVNDQYRGRSCAAYVSRFEELLHRAIGLAGRRDGVIVLSIPDWGVTPFAASQDSARIARDIDEFNLANRNVARRDGARYVDVTGITRRAAQMPGSLAADGLHPSGAMYATWADAVLPIALAITKGRPQA